MRVFSEISKYQQEKKCGVPILGLAKSIYYESLYGAEIRWKIIGGFLTSVSPNSKLTLSQVSQSSVVPPKFKRYNTWLSREWVSLEFGRVKFGAYSQAWEFISEI